MRPSGSGIGATIAGFIAGALVTLLAVVVVVPPGSVGVSVGSDPQLFAQEDGGTGVPGVDEPGAAGPPGDGATGGPGGGAGVGAPGGPVGSGGSDPIGSQDGLIGSTDSTGTTGTTDNTGSTDNTDTTGTTGTTDTTGSTDNTGTTGTTDNTGSTGNTDTTGNTGNTGNTGSSDEADTEVGAAELECAPGRNGGSTDTGVTGDRIRLGATVAESGVGASFLGEARFAMNAVVNRVNRAGGICGRFLTVKYVDDGWDAQEGFRQIRNLVEAHQVFALAVVPSSEGLNAASEAGYFERTGVPVVGSDGMIRTQYTDPYIFPVAASTVTMMHVMAKHALDQGAEKVGIVFEKTYRFGIEGAFAFNAEWKRHTGHDIPGYTDPFGGPTCGQGTQFCAIEAAGQAQGGYGTAARNFNAGCAPSGGEPCDFVAYLLEPATGLQWFRTADTRAASFYPLGAGAAQPLFTLSFGQQCGDSCDGLQLWTGYNPPIPPYDSEPEVQRYVNDLHSVNAQADEFNQFTEGAYLGMVALVEGLRATGPNLTREGLIDSLHRIEVDAGLSRPLTWRPGNHAANASVQMFEIQSRNQFKGFAFRQGYIRDPSPGEDLGG